MKNKPVERKVQELKDKKRCMKADLKYDLPDKLDGELIVAAKIAINSMLNRKTGPGLTP